MVELKQFYFSDYEQRRPEAPLKHSYIIEFIWQALAICTIALGARYRLVSIGYCPHDGAVEHPSL